MEAPTGDDSRGWGPFVDPDDGLPPEATDLLSANRDKESTALDLKTDEAPVLVTFRVTIPGWDRMSVIDASQTLELTAGLQAVRWSPADNGMSCDWVTAYIA